MVRKIDQGRRDGRGMSRRSSLLPRRVRGLRSLARPTSSASGRTRCSSSVDFVADGDYTGDPGYNTAGNLNKFISIDATADANTRLAYGTGGARPAPTVLPGHRRHPGHRQPEHHPHRQAVRAEPDRRAARRPVAGAAPERFRRRLQPAQGRHQLAATARLVDFSRASSPAAGGTPCSTASPIGNDPLAMLTSSTTPTPSRCRRAARTIYACTVDQLEPGRRLVAGTIMPLMPQVGSGTRLLPRPRSASPTPRELRAERRGERPGGDRRLRQPGQRDRADVAEPAVPVPGQAVQRQRPAASPATSRTRAALALSTTPAGCTDRAPSPRTSSSGRPARRATAARCSTTRPLYIYFRHADINSTTIFQPGGTLNWVRTMLYNPCSGAGAHHRLRDRRRQRLRTRRSTVVRESGGQANISASGITPTYAVTLGGP